VQIHQSDAHIVLAPPMPELEPQDIFIVMAGDKITIHGSFRGSRQEKEDILVVE
jgi:HSP20 family molecular chaperone IbpA